MTAVTSRFVPTAAVTGKFAGSQVSSCSSTRSRFRRKPSRAANPLGREETNVKLTMRRLMVDAGRDRGTVGVTAAIALLGIAAAIVLTLLVTPIGQAGGTASRVIVVPRDYPTIQAAIDAAAPGD